MKAAFCFSGSVINEMGIDDRVLKIKENTAEVSRLIEEYKPFIASCASGFSRRFLQYGEDDELSVAMQAFYEAVNSYQKERGAFLSFARGVIRRRLIDYGRSFSKAAEKEALSINEDDEGWRETEYAVSFALYEQAGETEARRQEIAALKEELNVFGIDFEELAQNCPKHKTLMRDMKRAAALLASSAALFKEMRMTRRLPLKEIEKISGIPLKKLEKFRKYIIVTAVILNGEYECLKEYVRL